MESEFFNNLNLWLSSAQLQEQLIGIKMVFILFGIIFLAVILYLLFKSSFLRVHFLQDWSEFLSYKAYELQALKHRWKKIRQRLESDSEGDWKLAVIESEELLNEILVLKGAGSAEETLEQKLEKTEDELLPNRQEVLKIHKIYKDMLADPDYHLTLLEAKKILNTIEETLINLEAI